MGEDDGMKEAAKQTRRQWNKQDAIASYAPLSCYCLRPSPTIVWGTEELVDEALSY